MEEFGIILLTIFMVLFACGVLYRLVRLTYIRMQDHCKYHPKASRFQDARRKLESVSECTSGSPRKQDLESGFNQDDVQPEWSVSVAPSASDHCSSQITRMRPEQNRCKQCPRRLPVGLPGLEGKPGRVSTWPPETQATLGTQRPSGEYR
ncbi:hypothetical protein LY78DRAFT_458006 [Colletotrichum sublineola]|nr:hypothetical protein LY78DRAFT_458006 [Colletotrichum sublineola]